MRKFIKSLLQRARRLFLLFANPPKVTGRIVVTKNSNDDFGTLSSKLPVTFTTSGIPSCIPPKDIQFTFSSWTPDPNSGFPPQPNGLKVTELQRIKTDNTFTGLIDLNVFDLPSDLNAYTVSANVSYVAAFPKSGTNIDLPVSVFVLSHEVVTN